MASIPSGSNKKNSGTSRYDSAKDSGGQKGFMESYGLKMHNPNDVQETKTIQDAMLEMDRQQASASKGKSGGK